MQAYFMCLAHHAMFLYEYHIREKHNIDYTAENKDREKRHRKRKVAFLFERLFPFRDLYFGLFATQRSLKFISFKILPTISGL